jgi:hypothetical protein
MLFAVTGCDDDCYKSERDCSNFKSSTARIVTGDNLSTAVFKMDRTITLSLELTAQGPFYIVPKIIRFHDKEFITPLTLLKKYEKKNHT